MVHNAHTDQHHDHENQAQCRSQIGIVGSLELAFDYVADENGAGAAQLLRDVEGGDSRGRTPWVMPEMMPGERTEAA